MSNKIVLSATDLTKTYDKETLPVEVLKGVDFTIRAGEQVAITGASGSGKSTLLHILGGLDTASQGQVIIDGTNLFESNATKQAQLRNRNLGFVYQFHHLLNEFSALENVVMPLLIRRVNVKKATQQAELMLQKVGLSHRLHHRPGQLSGGERQRAAVARALVTQPQCVLADEPTGNLDKHTATEVYELMLSLNNEFNISFVIVTHDQTLAKKMDFTLHLEDGKLNQV